MRTLLRVAALPLVLSLVSSALAADFKDHLGLQIYSLRAQAQTDPLQALDTAKSYGLTEVETYTGGWGKMAVADYAAELKKRGLVAVSGHFGIDLFRKDVAAVIKDAKTLGLKYVFIPFPPLDKDRVFTEEIARQTAAEFNAWGEACKKEGLQFGFHPHGPEFRPIAGGNGDTMFDILARETKPEFVTYELDVFWAFHAGQDPVKLMEKYPNRFAAIHIKDMAKSYEVGVYTGSAPPTAKVPIGTGKIDYVAVLKTAQKIGVKHYFLEDETPTPLQSIPDSFKYLRALKL
jgi:sugar phosphate isomerase/epimerase